MGMAASQARYLALAARRSNCEYEGQQINQARTNLANQSANLFNQMLGLSVPVPPSTQDFTKTQYSFTDGLNASTIDSWKQLGVIDENYNYVVTHHYYADVYTGSQKKLNDPQVQFSNSIPASILDFGTQVGLIQAAKTAVDEAQKAYDEAVLEYEKLENKAELLSTYKDATAIEFKSISNDENGNVVITNKDDTVSTYTKYDPNDPDQSAAFETWNSLLAEDIDPSTVYYNADSGMFILSTDINKLSNDSTYLTGYHIFGEPAADSGKIWKSINGMNGELATADNEKIRCKGELERLEDAYNSLNVPTYIGNSPLTNISELTEDQRAELVQILKDMEKNEIDTYLDKYFNPETGEYNGGIYTFKMNGVTYYTTYDDLANSAMSGTGPNNIDAQIKLAYYNADYVSTKIEKTEKALIETDGSGRFSSIRLENDSVKYELKMETVTDDVAYEDAMNQYYYENAKYDKMVQDINAKTSIIQQQDLQLELRLKQLDTERNALQTEIDAVQGVIKKNVDSTFKTFSN